jgi:outer membrane protein assembly factor BamA
MEYDTRDNETISRRGQYHTVSARVSPGIASWMPYTYLQLDTTLRFYVTVIPRWLGISVRVVADAFLGSPPFYELARFDDTPAIGGGKAIRGVPAQRYYGKVKLFENFEARGDLYPFRIKNKDFVLGLAAFFDAGRTWTELFHAHPELDGTGFGLKYGVGGGVRLQEGKTFVVRADVAWSPDATPLGAYVDAGEIF